MKDQDLRTETAARKALRKWRQRVAGVPTFVFEDPAVVKARVAIRGAQNAIARMAQRRINEAIRRKRPAHFGLSPLQSRFLNIRKGERHDTEAA